MLDVGANHAGGVLGAQGERLRLFRLRPRAILPRVHFFGDDVGFLADAAGKQRGVFKDGRADFAEVIPREHGACSSFNAVPKRRFRWQQVARPANGFQGGHGLYSLNRRGNEMRNIATTHPRTKESPSRVLHAAPAQSGRLSPQADIDRRPCALESWARRSIAAR